MIRYPDRGLHGRVVETLGRKIASGEIGHGETISMEQVAEQYDISRSVIREAIRVLTGKGLIDARPKRGTFVLPRERWNLLDPDVLRWQFDTMAIPGLLDELHEVRTMVEPAAAALAAERRNDSDLIQLHLALQQMSEPDISATDFADADLIFHRAIVAATQNAMMRQLGEVVNIGLRARGEYVRKSGVTLEHSLPLHRQIVDAIESSDSDLARSHMLELLFDAKRDVEMLNLHGLMRG